MSISADKDYDLVVIGAGTSGIAAARFYLEVHPEANVVVIERDNSVGGVWSTGQFDLSFKFGVRD
jgi:cation diffusion facilitator CzcD-associated flavoprotein CzcO